VSKEDTEKGDLSLLDLHCDSATSGQVHLGRLREMDIEDTIKKRDSLLRSSRIIGDRYDRCYRHPVNIFSEFTVDIGKFTLDGKKNLFLYIYH
jgi:hypothetical protein